MAPLATILFMFLSTNILFMTYVSNQKTYHSDTNKPQEILSLFSPSQRSSHEVSLAVEVVSTQAETTTVVSESVDWLLSLGLPLFIYK